MTMDSTPQERLRLMAMIIAMVVRNAMEDFHVAHLSDEQMRELNPIIRNAIYTALYAIQAGDEGSKEYIDFALKLIPKYWEPPEYLEDYIRTLEYFRGTDS